MSTYREIVYSILDQLKLVSDDSFYTEDHIIYLISKIRAAVLKKQYEGLKKEIPLSNYQTICLNLKQVPAIAGIPCEGGTYLRSTQKIPSALPIGAFQLFPTNYYQGMHISYVSRERMRYVGHNKWLYNIIYASKGPDDYLYFTSSNPQFLYLKKISMTAIFEDPEKAAKLTCEDSSNTTCDILDKEFPLEEGLITSVIELAIGYLSGAAYRPKDPQNNAADDLSELASYLRNNMKSNFQKQLE